MWWAAQILLKVGKLEKMEGVQNLLEMIYPSWIKPSQISHLKFRINPFLTVNKISNLVYEIQCR